MSLHSYHYSLRLSKMDPPFYSLIMAAMRKADSDNIQKLKSAFPETFRELAQRYNAPLGVLPEEEMDIDMEELKRNVAQMMGGSAE